MPEPSTPYTAEQLRRATDFLRVRLGLQRLLSRRLERALYRAAKQIAEIAARYSIAPRNFRFSADKQLNEEVDAVIRELIAQLSLDLEQSAVTADDEPEERSRILAVLAAAFMGKTAAQRFAVYARRFKYELEPAIAAALALGYSVEETAQRIRIHLHNPYANSLISYAAKNAFLARRAAGVSYGSGRYKAARNNLERVGVDTLARARTEAFKQKEEREYHTQEWYVMRGSSYPCELCDSKVGLHHDSTDLPPYHPNCVCIAIPSGP